MENSKDYIFESLLNKQNTLIKLLSLKCEETDLILSEINSPGEKISELVALSTSVNSTLKLILQEEKHILKALKKLPHTSAKIKIPKPEFSGESVEEKFESWNPEIEHPKEYSFKRVYEIPNNFRQ
ncbi:MAG: hypothetical protein IJC74_05625 [Clostridia bacterium]|nr:hypothetical protein [Clostridia bacterium]